MGSLDETIAHLEELAATVLRSKRTTRPQRPIVIEFCGSPKAGKTAAITSLTIFLKRNRFKVEVLTERASVCPIHDKTDWLFNTWTGCSALIELVPRIAEPSKDVDVVICDRGIFDALCWFNWLQDGGHLSPEVASTMREFFTLKRFRAAIDLIFSFTASPEVSMNREYAHLLTRKTGSIMNHDVLESYVAAIRRTEQENSDLFKKIESIDTTELNQEQVGRQVTLRVLEALVGRRI